MRGLNLGADDYVTKPFAIAEVIARVGAQVRRARMDRGDGETFEADGVRFDLGRLLAHRGPTEIPLTPREGEILRHLRRRVGNVVTRDEFLLAGLAVQVGGRRDAHRRQHARGAAQEDRARPRRARHRPDGARQRLPLGRVGVKRPLFVFGLMLVGPAVVLAALGWRSLAHEDQDRRSQAREEARRAADDAIRAEANRLETTREQEGRRPYFEYQARFMPQDVLTSGAAAFVEIAARGPSAAGGPLPLVPVEPLATGSSRGPTSSRRDARAARANWLSAAYGELLRARLLAAPAAPELRTTAPQEVARRASSRRTRRSASCWRRSRSRATPRRRRRTSRTSRTEPRGAAPRPPAEPTVAGAVDAVPLPVAALGERPPAARRVAARLDPRARVEGPSRRAGRPVSAPGVRLPRADRRAGGAEHRPERAVDGPGRADAERRERRRARCGEGLPGRIPAALALRGPAHRDARRSGLGRAGAARDGRGRGAQRGRAPGRVPRGAAPLPPPDGRPALGRLRRVLRPLAQRAPRDGARRAQAGLRRRGHARAEDPARRHPHVRGHAEGGLGARRRHPGRVRRPHRRRDEAPGVAGRPGARLRRVRARRLGVLAAPRRPRRSGALGGGPDGPGVDGGRGAGRRRDRAGPAPRLVRPEPRAAARPEPRGQRDQVLGARSHEGRARVGQAATRGASPSSSPIAARASQRPTRRGCSSRSPAAAGRRRAPRAEWGSGSPSFVATRRRTARRCRSTANWVAGRR